MKILAIEENILNPPGGGELSFRTLLGELSGRHDIFPYGRNGSIPVHAAYSLSGFPVFGIPRTQFLNKYLAFAQVERRVAEYIHQLSPDLILTQQDFAAPTLKAACSAGVPSVVFVRNYEHFCLCNDPEKECDRHCSACYGYRRYNPYRYCVDAVFAYEKHWLAQASLVVSNSVYMKHVVNDWLGIDSVVVYPFIRTFRVSHRDPEYITFVNPQKHKGIDTVLKIADLLPERKFLVVGPTHTARRLRAPANVVHNPWVEDMSDVYSRTRILLVPSIWPEPFGRVCVEAAQCGIPCIASRIGGIPEAVGNGGILVDDSGDPDEWVQAITALDSERIYRELSGNAQLNAEKFSLENVLQTFTSAVREKLGIRL